MLYGIPWLDTSLVAVLGLLIGSFLNVVIHRLPKMMERQWQCEAAEFTGSTVPDAPPLNLVVPRSRCPHCGHAITWYENIPLVSYLALGGQCSSCKGAISVRYPLVEMATSALFGYCAYRYGVSSEGLLWCVFSAVLLAAALIDWDTTLLPDSLTLPLVWLGMLGADQHWLALDLHSSFWGAVGGYLSLWTIYWAFKLATGKEGMGFGDFKLYAALGAWFGWMALIPLILLASVVGAVVGIALKLRGGLREGGYIPFGPFLAGAGFCALVLGPQRLQQLIGF